MDRERLVAWNLELQGAHHALEAALNRARLSVNTGGPVDSLATNLTLHCRGFCAALDDHHRTEDVALFPRLVAESPELGDTIAALMRDHRTLVGLLANFETSLADLGQPEDCGQGRGRLDAQLDRIEAVMKSHFSDEERHLHAAMRTLGADSSEKEGLLGSPPHYGKD